MTRATIKTASRLLPALLCVLASAAVTRAALESPACRILPLLETPTVGRTVILQATVTNSSSDPISYQWHLGGGFDGLLSGRSLGDEILFAEVAFTRGDQAFPITLTLTDAAGRVSSCRRSISVGTLTLVESSTAVQEQDPPSNPAEGDHAVLAFNDIGMHCMDLGSRPLLIRPPLNTLHAQVVERGDPPTLLEATETDLRYSAASSASDPVLSPLILDLDGLPPIEGLQSFSARELLSAGNVELAEGAEVRFASGRRVNMANGFSVARTALLEVLIEPTLEAPSTNSTSRHDPPHATADAAQTPKSDLWDPVDPLNPLGATVAAALFGVDPQPDEGLPTARNAAGGRRMPGISNPYEDNLPQPFSSFETASKRFIAEGIPLTPIDDVGRLNPYPLLRVQAVEPSTDEVLATIDTVAPVSTGIDCRDCHLRGEVGADPTARTPGIPFVYSELFGDPLADERSAKQNILLLHDFKWGTDHAAGPSVLCASCHESHTLETVFPVLDPGEPPHLSLSNVMHDQHGRFVIDAASEELVRDGDGEPILRTVPAPGERFLLLSDPADPAAGMEQSCFSCHPGESTPYFRGVMSDPGGLDCSSCHGSMLAVGGLFGGDFDGNGVPRARRPWSDEPRCESCHLGDAVDPGVADLPATLAFDLTDAAAVPTLATNERFAENRGAGGELILYRDSHGHGGIACAGCHGAPHAIWPHPNPAANDNLTPIQLQGRAGSVADCVVCHETGTFPSGNLDGPHGLHPIGDPDWINSSGSWHRSFATSPGDDCAPCHGADHLGTRLSRALADRELRDASGTLQATVAAGDIIACDLCHALADSF